MNYCTNTVHFRGTYWGGALIRHERLFRSGAGQREALIREWALIRSFAVLPHSSNSFVSN